MIYQPIPLGKVCRCCHQWMPLNNLVKSRKQPLGRDSICKPCNRIHVREYQREYRKRNPEKGRAATKKWRASHLEQSKVESRERYWANPEKSREQYRGYYAANPEKAREKQRKWKAKDREINPNKRREYDKQRYWSNPEFHRQRVRDYRRRNPDKVRSYAKAYQQSEHGAMIFRVLARRRKASKIAAGGIYTANDVQAQHKRQKGKCYWCGKKVGKNFHVDHVIPLSKGGTNDPSNIVIACPECNVRKNNKLPHEWEGNGGRML